MKREYQELSQPVEALINSNGPQQRTFKGPVAIIGNSGFNGVFGLSVTQVIDKDSGYYGYIQDEDLKYMLPELTKTQAHALEVLQKESVTCFLNISVLGLHHPLASYIFDELVELDVVNSIEGGPDDNRLKIKTYNINDKGLRVLSYLYEQKMEKLNKERCTA